MVDLLACGGNKPKYTFFLGLSVTQEKLVPLVTFEDI
jgi:hypothetical protein